MRMALFAISLLMAVPGFAQETDPYSIGNCAQSQADTYLEVGNIRARILNNGSLFWSGKPNVYQIPATGAAQAIFAATLLVGGLIDEEIRASGSTYGPYEFWPGPIPADGSAPSNCSDFDRLWHLDFNDHLRFQDEHPVIPEEVAEWPVELNAPFLDVNGTPGYQPDEGDLPEMRGDRQVWWVMNDRGNRHTRFGTEPLAIEVQASAYGFDSPGALGNTSFYRYRIINKGSRIIRDMVIGKQIDFDLGNAGDDRLGTDSTLAMFYVYNADNDDGGTSGYGSPVPALGFVVLEASHSNRNLPTDKGAAPARHLTSTAHPQSGAITGILEEAEDAYNYLTGNWRDGTPRTEGGNGFRYSTIRMPFWMPGDPVAGSYWSEVNSDNRGTPIVAADRIGVAGFGTFDLAPGEWATFTFAYVWARGADHLDSISELREAARFLHETKAILLAPRTIPPRFDDTPSPDVQYPFWVGEPYPNPASNRLTLRASFDKSGPAIIRIVDVLGRTLLEETQNVDAAGSREIPLDVSGLRPGPYTVTVESWSHRASQSIVVVR